MRPGNANLPMIPATSLGYVLSSVARLNIIPRWGFSRQRKVNCLSPNMWEKSGVVGELTGSLIICCQGGGSWVLNIIAVDGNPGIHSSSIATDLPMGRLLDNIKKSPRLLVFSRLVLLACHIEPGIRYGIFDLPCDINLALLRIFPSQSSR